MSTTIDKNDLFLHTRSLSPSLGKKKHTRTISLLSLPFPLRACPSFNPVLRSKAYQSQGVKIDLRPRKQRERKRQKKCEGLFDEEGTKNKKKKKNKRPERSNFGVRGRGKEELEKQKKMLCLTRARRKTASNKISQRAQH